MLSNQERLYKEEFKMLWHILTIVFGTLLFIISFFPSLYSDFYNLVLFDHVLYLSIIFAALVVIFAFMSLTSYRKLLKK